MYSQNGSKEHKLVLQRGSERTPWALRHLLQDPVLNNSKIMDNGATLLFTKPSSYCKEGEGNELI